MRAIVATAVGIMVCIVIVIATTPGRSLEQIALERCLPDEPREISHIAVTENGYECSIVTYSKRGRAIKTRRVDVQPESTEKWY